MLSPTMICLISVTLIGTVISSSPDGACPSKNGAGPHSLIQKTQKIGVAVEDDIQDEGDDCRAADWGVWGECSKTCASKPDEAAGKMTRFRNVEPKKCTNDFEEGDCPNLPCPVDCKMSEWSDWGGCSGKCKNEGAKQKRTRTVVQAPANGGTCCPTTEECETTTEDQGCGPALNVTYKECGAEKIKCEATQWSPWTECSKSCNTGVQTRSRGIAQPSVCGGAPCLCDFLETKNCESAECLQECVPGPWSDWSECPATCGGAVQTRSREVATLPAGGAEDCPALVETKNCAEVCCNRDCVLSDWDEWSQCSATCYGTQKRKRKVDVEPCGSGKPCEALAEAQTCRHQCVLPCQVGEWGPWTQCSATCGGGSKTRTRPITQAPKLGGAECPAVTETSCCSGSNVGCPEAGGAAPAAPELIPRPVPTEPIPPQPAAPVAPELIPRPTPTAPSSSEPVIAPIQRRL